MGNTKLWLKKKKNFTQQQPGDNEFERLERKKLKLFVGPRLHMEGIVVQEADYLAENERVKGLGTSIKTRDMFRGNATLREMN